MKTCGAHIAAVRNWMQCKCSRGSYVTWGSGDDLGRHITPRDLEEIAQWVAEATAKETEEKMRSVLGSMEKLAKLTETPSKTQENWIEVSLRVHRVICNIKEFLGDK